VGKNQIKVLSPYQEKAAFRLRFFLFDMNAKKGVVGRVLNFLATPGMKKFIIERQ
jgi:hypothetical protein